VEEIPLIGGDLTAVVRVDQTVRRPVGPWSPAVHALLRHFEQAGFDGAPRFLGIDEEGREVLSFVEGIAGQASARAGDEVVVELGRLIRRAHDAQDGFVPPADAVWQRLPGERPDGEVICHNDLFWTNVVFKKGLPVAFIDWDLATPGSRLADIASAAYYWVPLRPDEQAVAWGVPTDRRGERLRLLCDAYGLDAGQRSLLLEDFLQRRLLAYEAHRVWGGVERRRGWREMWENGSGEMLLANIRWIESHRAELERWL
jgi:aminoglycoside phosphotransferase (APT) family kinase protein